MNFMWSLIHKNFTSTISINFMLLSCESNLYMDFLWTIFKILCNYYVVLQQLMLNNNNLKINLSNFYSLSISEHNLFPQFNLHSMYKASDSQRSAECWHWQRPFVTDRQLTALYWFDGKSLVIKFSESMSSRRLWPIWIHLPVLLNFLNFANVKFIMC